MRLTSQLPRLHLITDTRLDSNPIQTAEAALDAGVRLIQVRTEDHFTDRAEFDLARCLMEMCRQSGAWCLINDSVHIAQAVGADGVHLGDDDLPVDAARRILDPTLTIGATCRGPQSARAARRAGADYLGVGPVNATTTKISLSETLGTDGLKAVCTAVELPVVAVGGIDAASAASCRAAGAHGVAVVSAVSRARDVRSATSELLDAVGETFSVPPQPPSTADTGHAASSSRRS
ncbi:thiamine phosphate synthase [Haloglycomyces albus]|uniref:thiamine phosphate synthase n=1 Tax=Haloglycomyces albus TaxID=526067 RepID=UPI0004B9B4B0|nr:thiamine phosphate synthase [Haloglycomyces albus]